tara:strand:+ start:542 stop:1498 length:957 start_codon:yes stop_codon:yes gene_type:complete
MKVRLTHIDGKLPNLALMKLAHWHHEQGHSVYLERGPQPNLFEPDYDMVYASTIFEWSKPVIGRLKDAFPEAFVGGTGTGGDWRTVEEHIGESEYEHYDYSIYPDYEFSLGFTQRGCRLKCGFCVVPKKEGRPKSTNTIYDIWREGSPRAVVLLDNDFFGQPDTEWKARLEEIREGGFKVNFNQGINIRMITDVAAEAIASVPYYGTDFKARRIYTAWDNLGQEKLFFKGFDRLVAAGVPPGHIMVYMLIGYAPGETMEELLYRFQRMKDAGCLPYPMVYNNRDKALKRFQRWVVGRYHWVVSWEDFSRGAKVKGETI